MEKDKLPPRYHQLKADPSASSSSPLPSQPQEDSSTSNRFSHDISRISDFPPWNPGHRRDQSEVLSLPDDLTFNADLGVVVAAEGPSFSDETEEECFAMYLDMDKLGAYAPGVAGGEISTAAGGAQVLLCGPSSSSLLQDESLGSWRNERLRVRHRHSQSDGSTTIKDEMLGSGSEGPGSLAEAKKAVLAAKLADLELVDPKRAKRDRQSAACSKERKMRCMGEVQRKVETLQTEAKTLSAHLSMLQIDTSGLTAENSELKVGLQSMEQQVHRQDDELEDGSDVAEPRQDDGGDIFMESYSDTLNKELTATTIKPSFICASQRPSNVEEGRGVILRSSTCIVGAIFEGNKVMIVSDSRVSASNDRALMYSDEYDHKIQHLVDGWLAAGFSGHSEQGEYLANLMRQYIAESPDDCVDVHLLTQYAESLLRERLGDGTFKYKVQILIIGYDLVGIPYVYRVEPGVETIHSDVLTCGSGEFFIAGLREGCTGSQLAESKIRDNFKEMLVVAKEKDIHCGGPIHCLIFEGGRKYRRYKDDTLMGDNAFDIPLRYL